MIPRRIDNPPYAPISVLPEDIDVERDMGGERFHPEDYCHRCGSRNTSWHISNDAWAVAGVDGRWQEIICIPCFIELFESASDEGACWHLSRDEYGSEALEVRAL